MPEQASRTRPVRTGTRVSLTSVGTGVGDVRVAAVDGSSSTRPGWAALGSLTNVNASQETNYVSGAHLATSEPLKGPPSPELQ